MKRYDQTYINDAGELTEEQKKQQKTQRASALTAGQAARQATRADAGAGLYAARGQADTSMQATARNGAAGSSAAAGAGAGAAAQAAPAAGAGAGAAAQAAPAAGLGRGDVTAAAPGNYDPAGNAAYQSAMAALRQAEAQLPNYNSSYAQDVAGIYAQITGQQPFSYDVEGDPLYQQYRQLYTQQGQQAMMDTMGQAAALTGGYGSTYGQSVGQQQYNAYLQQLNSIIPELYDRAYQQYQDRGDALYRQYSMARDLEDAEYSRYRDSIADYWDTLDYATQQEQLAYNRGAEDWARNYQLYSDAYDRQQDAYSKLLQTMTATGYSPSEEDLRAAGMTTPEATAWMDYWARQNTPTVRYSGGSGTQDDEGAVPYTETATTAWSGGRIPSSAESAAQKTAKTGISSAAQAAQAAQSSNYDYQGVASSLEDLRAAGANSAALSAFVDAAYQNGLLDDGDYKTLKRQNRK